jgi:hypothetical protein
VIFTSEEHVVSPEVMLVKLLLGLEEGVALLAGAGQLEALVSADELLEAHAVHLGPDLTFLKREIVILLDLKYRSEIERLSISSFLRRLLK